MVPATRKPKASSIQRFEFTFTIHMSKHREQRHRQFGFLLAGHRVGVAIAELTLFVLGVYWEARLRRSGQQRAGRRVARESSDVEGCWTVQVVGQRQGRHDGLLDCDNGLLDSSSRGQNDRLLNRDHRLLRQRE